MFMQAVFEYIVGPALVVFLLLGMILIGFFAADSILEGRLARRIGRWYDRKFGE